MIDSRSACQLSPCCSLPFHPNSPPFLKLPFTGLRTRLSRCVPKDRPIDLYTSRNLLPSPLRIPRSFPSFLRNFCFQVSTGFYVLHHRLRIPSLRVLFVIRVESAVFKFHGLFCSNWREADIIRFAFVLISKSSSFDFFFLR